MNPQGLGSAILVLIGMWALAGAVRHWKDLEGAAQGARSATLTGLHRHTQPGGAGTPGSTSAVHVLAELGVNLLAAAAFLAAGTGYALIAEPAAAVRSRRAAHRPAPTPEPAPVPSHPALTVEPANVVDGEVVSDTEDPAPGSTGGPGATPPRPPGPGDIEDAVIVPDPTDPANTTPKGAPVSDLSTTPDLAVTTTASTTLGQAKRDLARATEASATVAQWSTGQATVAEVRHETSNARTTQTAALAQQAANAAAWARSSAEAAAAQGADVASVRALAAAAAQFDAASQTAASGAVQASNIATAEANLAETFHLLNAQMQNAAALAENARATLAAQQDVHAQAFAQTSHTGADASYLADAGI